jgi:hypothetical protein
MCQMLELSRSIIRREGGTGYVIEKRYGSTCTGQNACRSGKVRELEMEGRNETWTMLTQELILEGSKASTVCSLLI